MAPYEQEYEDLIQKYEKLEKQATTVMEILIGGAIGGYIGIIITIIWLV